MDDSSTVQWRWDASTSRTVRVLWALGIGVFLAALVLIIFARLFALTEAIGGQLILIAMLVAAAVTVVALAIAGRSGDRLESVTRRLPLLSLEDSDGNHDIERVLDIGVGAVAMGVFMLVFALGVGGGVGHGTAAITIPLGLIAIVLAAFLSSTGALDIDEGVLYLYEPEDAVDLADIDGVRVRTIGEIAVVTLSYDQSDGRYISGPRRLAVPIAVAEELETLIRSRPSQ